MIFIEAPTIIKVECYRCQLVHEWFKSDLEKRGVGANAPMPKLLDGLARLLNCERHKLSPVERKSNPCGLSYSNIMQD